MKFTIPALPTLNDNKKFWIILGVVLWLCFALSQLPAVWGAYLLTRSGDIAMNGVSGTLWSGRASLASIKLKGQDYSIGQLSWRLSALSLFTFRPCAHLTTHMDNQEFDGRVCMRGKTGLTITDATINFPAALVQPLLPLPIAGQFFINIDQLHVSELQLLRLKGKATWDESKIFNGSNWMGLGSVGAELSDDGKKGLVAKIVDVNSPLHLDLTGTLPYPTGAAIKGTFSLPQAYFQQLNAGAWLSMFATPQPNDPQGNLVYTVDLNF